jgi:hypothetical protein
MQLLRLVNAYKAKPVRRRIGLPEPDSLKGPKTEAINERLKGHVCIVPETDSVIFCDSFKPHCFLRFVRNNALASELKNFVLSNHWSMLVVGVIEISTSSIQKKESFHTYATMLC